MGSLTWLGRGDLADRPCPYCGRVADPDDETVVAAEQAWGFVGAGLSLHGEPSAQLLVTPFLDAPSALVTCLWVAPELAGRGRGKRLVQATAAGLLSQNVSAILARGLRTGSDCAAPPAEFLRAVGFTRIPDERLSRLIPGYPTAPAEVEDAVGRLYRLNLSATVTTPSGLRGWIEHWLRAWRPIGPAPAGRVAERRGR